MTALKSDAALTQLIPAARVFGQSAPSLAIWPFTKMGVPIGVPVDGSCHRGEDIRWARHVFAGPRLNAAGQEVEIVEDHVGRIVAALKGALHRSYLPTTGGYAKMRCINDQRMIEDSEASQYHAVVEFRVKVMTAVAA